MAAIRVELLTYGSSVYELAVQLRYEVLRQPLGLVLDPADMATDSEEAMFGAFLKHDLVGCLHLRTLNAEQVKMRQVAVKADLRGQGVGALMVKASEMWAAENGFREIVLNARAVVIPFYLGLGYEAFGGPFEEVGIPHRAMRKKLI
ncbi:MAG: GNAT family N-acetyltransferase [Armatimonadetes bacterium]|nr:GNAT family N-acetyltransferase [Armatimonadota bacterium]